MDLKDIQEMARVSNEAIKQTQEQHKILESVINEALKKAPEKDKKEVNRIRNLMLEVTKLIEKGDADGAQKIIKEFTDGKNSK